MSTASTVDLITIRAMQVALSMMDAHTAAVVEHRVPNMPVTPLQAAVARDMLRYMLRKMVGRPCFDPREV